MAKANILSPYFINVADTNLTSVKIELDVYTGYANTSFTASPTYTLTSTAIDAKVTFEVAELIKDYILAEFNGTYPELGGTTVENTTIYFDYRITKYISGVEQTPETPVYATIAYYGYGYFEDGANPQLAQGYLQSNDTILKSDDGALRIPVDYANFNSVTFFKKGEVIDTYTKPASVPRVEDAIIYVSNEEDGTDSFRDRVLTDGGVYEESFCINEFLKSTSLYDVDEVYVDGTEGVTVIKVENIEECKYEPYKLTFINKFGAYQDLWMFKTSNLSISAKDESFKRNILSDGSYNTYKHQKTILYKNAVQKLVLNSGYYPESNNELFKQLVLSERVWIEYNDKTLPAYIQSNNLNFKTSLNDKLIEYQIELEFAYQTINNIR
jgi:hypothetical protein|tara:strand:+ start:18523 stop:19671 length:1149 start_codon:yes stop_codon:yes gene_type:complete